MAAYTQSSLLEIKPHGGESNGGFSLKSSDVGCGAEDSFECGFVSRGENEKNATASSFFVKESNGDEVHRQFEEGFLNIFIHHALGIHNICIYSNQDVYAKFCLSHDPEKALCTRVVKKGGKNPVFNQSLQIGSCHPDSVLKCEIWMSSQALSYLEDQLLGFVLVPLSSLVGKGEHSQEYALSSTELFHSHAGTIKLTLMYHEQRRSSSRPQLFKGLVPSGDLLGADLQPEGTNDGSMVSDISSNCSLMEKLFASDYGNVEFSDMEAIAEDQQLVSKYLSAASNKEDCTGVAAAAAENGMITGPPYLRIGSVTVDRASCRERAGEEQGRDISSMTDDCQIFNFPAPQVPNTEKNFSAFSNVSEVQSSGGSQMEVNNSPSSTTYPTFSSSQTTSGTSSSQDFHSGISAPNTGMQIESEKERAVAEDALGGIVTVPLVNLTIETEGPKVVQQQIVDMYVKSMNQFTEALAKMQLPVDMDSQEAPPAKNSSSEHGSGESGKKNSHRVFYGSRAFF